MAAITAAASSACAGLALSHAKIGAANVGSTLPAMRLAPTKVSWSRVASKGQRPVSSRPDRCLVSAKLDKMLAIPEVAQGNEIFEDEHTQSQVAQTMAGSLFLLLANTGSAAAAQEVLQLADADARGLLLLFVLAPAVGWVLFNILQPALNQLNKMTGAKAVVGALGLGAAGSLLAAPQAEAAQEITQLAADNRPLILLFILTPAIGWVLFNILKPALNQFNKMRGMKSVVGALGLGAAASLLAAPDADAAQEIAQLAADSRPLILLFILVPAVGWVLFNILQPALRQVTNMVEKNSSDGKKKR